LFTKVWVWFDYLCIKKTKLMIKVLVHYKQWVDSGNVHFDDTLEDRSKIVEVKDLLELNDMFRHITKIEVIN